MLPEGNNFIFKSIFYVIKSVTYVGYGRPFLLLLRIFSHLWLRRDNYKILKWVNTLCQIFVHILYCSFEIEIFFMLGCLLGNRMSGKVSTFILKGSPGVHAVIIP
jgi:hypothetical protein